jgi:hypothetical protein
MADEAERIARSLVVDQGITLPVGSKHENPGEACCLIAEAIRGAVLAERERCAATIEGFATDQPGIGVSYWGEALAKAIREGVPAAPVPSWTRTPPTVAGWYWIRWPSNSARGIAHFDGKGGYASVRGYFCGLEEIGSSVEWCGPIEPPA